MTLIATIGAEVASQSELARVLRLDESAISRRMIKARVKACEGRFRGTRIGPVERITTKQSELTVLNSPLHRLGASECSEAHNSPCGFLKQSRATLHLFREGVAFSWEEPNSGEC